METLIYVLLPLVISGLGFLSYKHPKLTRQIVYVLMFITFLVYIGNAIALKERQRGLAAAAILTNFKNNFVFYTKVNTDSILKIYGNTDSGKFMVEKAYLEVEKNVDVARAEMGIQDSIRVHIFSEMDKTIDEDHPGVYFLFAITVLIIFLILCALFEYIHKKPEKD